MTKQSKSNSLTDGVVEPAHFVPLGVIRAEYGGSLEAYIRRHAVGDVVITMAVDMAVAGQNRQKFFVAVAVTTHFDEAESLSDEVERMAPKNHMPLFAWVPAHLYGSDDFGIFIDDAPIGENLKNGLVAEIIDSAAIEAAVMAVGKSLP